MINGKQQTVSSLTFVFRSGACRVQPGLTAARVRQWWYDNGDGAPITASMQRYYKVRGRCACLPCICAGVTDWQGSIMRVVWKHGKRRWLRSV